MKIFIYCLISTLLFLTGWCEDENEDCTELPKEITVKVYAEIEDKSDLLACEETYAVDFWKVHCGGGPSGTMSYIFKGCYNVSEELTYVKKEGIGTWDVTFKYKEDNLHVKVVDYEGKEMPDIGMNPIIDGNRIYNLTNGGSQGLGIKVTLTSDPEYTVWSEVEFN